MTKGKKQRSLNTVTRAQLSAMLRNHDMATREIKKYTAYNGASTTSAGVVTPITVNIPQGDNISNRSGDQIRVVRFDLVVEANLNALATVERVRVIFFIDHFNLGSTPAVTDVLDTATTQSFYNYMNDQAHRFKVLYDKIHTLCANGKAGVTDKSSLPFKKSKLVNFLGTTGVQGAGHFYVLVISDLGSNNGACTTSWNLRYQDA